MKILGKQDVKNKIIGEVRSGKANMHKDNNGQLIIYTDLYQWQDGTIRDEAEPNTTNALDL